MSSEELLKDAEFMDRIQEANSIAEIIELFRSKGIEVTEADLRSALDGQEGELSEEGLEEVAGGAAFRVYIDKRMINRLHTVGPNDFIRKVFLKKHPKATIML